MSRKRKVQRMEQERRKKQRKKLFVVIVGIIAVLIVGYGVIGYMRAQPQHYTVEGVEVTVEEPQRIGEGRISEALQAMGDWIRFYASCGRSITVRPLQDTREERFQSGTVVHRFEYAVMGEIDLGQEDVAYDLALHAMSHACLPNDREINPPWNYSGGVIVGVDGLSLQVIPTGQEKNGFQLFEEGVAELLAQCVSAQYHPAHDPRYEEVLALTRQYFTCTDARPLAGMIQHNDIETFVRIVLDRRVDEPVSGQEVERVMVLYQLAWNRGTDRLNSP